MTLSRICAAAMAATIAIGSQSALAQPREQVAPNRTVGQVKVYGSFATIRVSPPIANTNGCDASTADDQFLLDWTDEPERKSMYAAILLAKATGETVGFGLQGCSDAGFPLIYRLDVGRP